ncbi:MAG: Sua5/YciO/YrdC/YwlC family protein, partial [Candidatus Stygibacter frigidus]|nr:Sua5/YciO/YrdC/YwlC family protein [Candidatus Stygibacter frigidus]
MKLFHEMSPEIAGVWQKADSPILLHYTGSMFGMGCDARDQAAITKINELKKRSPERGYIVLIADYRKLLEYNPEMNPRLSGLVKQYSPGALTVVMPCSHGDLQHLLVKDKIAFRIPDAPLLRDFLSQME